MGIVHVQFTCKHILCSFRNGYVQSALLMLQSCHLVAHNYEEFYCDHFFMEA